MIDIERIMQTEIPDIAAVYGGVRGRTMSSRHQSYAWPILVEAGVKRIIDLREADQSDRLPRLCQHYGLEYFHYPIDNAAKTIKQMAELFSSFCEMIDKGEFYIACAMGLHRTDIALCTYWCSMQQTKVLPLRPSEATEKRMGITPTKLCVCSMLSIFSRQSKKAKIPYI